MNSFELSAARTNTVINYTSKEQEKVLHRSIKRLATHLSSKYNVSLEWDQRVYLSDIVGKLNKNCGGHFSYERTNSSIKPDGGILNVVLGNKKYPILISEVKNQGTNDRRMESGMKHQAMGNAIERLSKNVAACQTWLLDEDVFPFIAFGYGCDFKIGSSIRDRIVSMNSYGELNKINVFRVSHHRLQRASMFFREAPWSEEEIFEIIRVIAEDSINYYIRKYGK